MDLNVKYKVWISGGSGGNIGENLQDLVLGKEFFDTERKNP